MTYTLQSLFEDVQDDKNRTYSRAKFEYSTLMRAWREMLVFVERTLASGKARASLACCAMRRQGCG